MSQLLKTIGFCIYDVIDTNHPQNSKTYIIKFRDKDIAKRKSLLYPGYQYIGKTELVRMYGTKIAEQTRFDTIHGLNDAIDLNTEPYIHVNI